MKLLSVIFLQSWAVTLSANDCVYPEYAISEEKSMEVYHMTHIVNTAINEAVKVDFMENSLTLPSGTVCPYNTGTCFDSQARVRYSWDVSKNLSVGDLTCRDVMRLYTYGSDFDYTYHILTLKRDPLVRFLVAESAVSMFFLQLMKEETLCNKTVWRTDRSELVVAVGEKNFFTTTYEFADTFISSSTSTSRKEDIYTDMMLKCQLYSHVMEEEKTRDEEVESDNLQDLLSSYKEEIVQLRETLSNFQSDLLLKNYEFESLRHEVNDIKVAMQDMQEEIDKYKIENLYLKEALEDVKNKLLLVKPEAANLRADFREREDLDDVEVSFSKRDNTLRKENMLTFPQFIVEALSNPENCPNFIFFPYDYLLCILASGLYVIFAVINTIMNYFSLRLLRNTKQQWFVFYTLTQGLTTRYICRNQILTKNKVDKWLLDIE